MESIYNIFLYFVGDTCSEVGYAMHPFDGTDEQAGQLLHARLEADLANATRLRLKHPFTHARLIAGHRMGIGHHLFDEAFEGTGAGREPMMLVSEVEHGRPRVNYQSGTGPLDMKDVDEKLGAYGVMDDWLAKYATDDGIDLPRLIHDDYFLAIKATFNAQHYVSSMKLLLSCIDSLSYIEFGDVQGNFSRWLDEHADLARLGITSEELWEMRNGIVHMTNVHSRRVRRGTVRRISFGVNAPESGLWSAPDGIFFFNFHGLIEVVGDAIGHWLSAHAGDIEWFATFISRYDETVSDSRVAVSGVLRPTTPADNSP